jgi:hypothetical protein
VATVPVPPELNWIANFIWSIADDVLRDLYVRGKYRDVILPMTVLRRLDAVLEPTKQAVLDLKASLDKSGIVNQDTALRDAAGKPFYNTSKFTLRDLRARASQQQLKADFEEYLEGFSSNVQDILNNFEFRNQIPRLSKADALGTLIEKYLDPAINLSPDPVRYGDGSVKHPGLDNHAMGTIFEELVRRFNEENNEEAGEHWTPRDVVRLMARLIFVPITDQISSATYLLYDGACGTGGMLTVAEGIFEQLANERGKQVSTHLYGQEINAETYAICKADLLLSEEGEAADNIVGGPEHSTLSNDAFPSREFDFMLSNPPYGKSWKSDLERMGGKDGIKDPRFCICSNCSLLIGDMMTTLLVWVGADERGSASIRIATDSRISWSSKDGTVLWKWDFGRKVFASERHPEVIGYCGDVLFPSQTLSQVVELMDRDAFFPIGIDHRDKTRYIVETLEKAASTYPLQETRDFTIVYCTRVNEGVECAFDCNVVSFSAGKSTDTSSVDIPSTSGVLKILGSGKGKYKPHLSEWQSSDVGGTSRALFSSFCEFLHSHSDNKTGGPPQLAGLFREGAAKSFGIVWDERLYLVGMEMRAAKHKHDFDCYNDLFELCDPVTLQRCDGAQPQPSPFRVPT